MLTFSELLERTGDQIFSKQELDERLAKKDLKMTLKFGADVTAPDLHIGHAVNLWLYRSLQELGHKFVFLVGDFTTRIGDPTGRSKTRPIIPEEEIQANAEKFIEQVKRIVIDDPEVFEVQRNSEWLGKLSALDLLQLMSTVTQDKLLSRDMFRTRVEQGLPIYQHELIYPLIQGYDSVCMGSHLTIVGSDQLFNEMMGRDLQAQRGQMPQIVITTKITPGIDGKGKQSKSVGNYIGLDHSPRDKFGRVMSIPDEIVMQYFDVYTDLPADEITAIQNTFTSDPMSAKLRLASEIVARYHGSNTGEAEREWFTNAFSKREDPDDAPEITLQSSTVTVLNLLRACYPSEEKSGGELKRLVKQGGVKLEGQTLSDPNAEITIPEEGALLKIGKRSWFKVRG